MPERKEHAPGTPSWTDLQTTDTGAAKAFYGELLGWTFDDLPVDADQGVFYSMAKVRGLDVAAIAPLGPDMAGVPPHWNSYVTVSDVDASAAVAEAAGGTVIAPAFDVMDAGRMAVVADPTGAIFMLWQVKNSIGAQLVNEPGALVWTELISSDIPKAAAFYNKVFGWTSNAVEGMEYTEFKLDGESIAGAMSPPMPGIPDMWGIYLAVGDTDTTVAKAKSLGGSVMVEPTDIPPGRFAVIADPQGAVFSIMKMK